MVKKQEKTNKFLKNLPHLRHQLLQKQPQEVFYRKRCFKNFTKFTGKHQCQSLFFNKVTGLRSEDLTFIKKETLAQVFSVIFSKFLKQPLYRTPPDDCF